LQVPETYNNKKILTFLKERSMTKEPRDRNKYVKQQTLLITALVALVAGFLGGLVVGDYKSKPETPGEILPLPQQPAQIQGPAAEQRSKILALERQASLNPGNFEIWTQLGNLYFDSSDFKNAIRAYMYRRDGQPTEAIKAFDKAIEIDPRHEIARFNKGVVFLHDLKNFNGAIRTWEELLRINPSARAPGGQPLKELVAQLKRSMKK
jgi:cytochrome c-type biogenesis protein CcmH/NrfG